MSVTTIEGRLSVWSKARGQRVTMRTRREHGQFTDIPHFTKKKGLPVEIQKPLTFELLKLVAT
jgi:hypothetical protein